MSDHSVRVLFAPDWRDGVPYQNLLADALNAQSVNVSFLRNYKRVLPLSRLCRNEDFDILHLHWPEAYYPPKGDHFDWFRNSRFTFDLNRAARGKALVVTAHNLHAHNRADELFGQYNYAAAFRRADAVVAHSSAARSLLLEKFTLSPERIHVVPHGDLSAALPARTARDEARHRLRLGDLPVCLMFGTVNPYKGIEDVLAYWNRARPEMSLAVVGKPGTDSYGKSIKQIAEGNPNVHLHFTRLTDEELALWLSAVDCVLFNYRAILTSGAACLTRSLGIPLLINGRAKTVDLQEPDPRVIRFESFDEHFASSLTKAVEVGVSYAAAESWRVHTSWERVARLTADAYRRIL